MRKSWTKSKQNDAAGDSRNVLVPFIVEFGETENGKESEEQEH